MEEARQGSCVPECVCVGDGRVRAQGREVWLGPETPALSQGLLLWLLLNVGGAWTSRGPLRPLCRPINATLAAENEACPVCITFTTTICAGYCPSMVSCGGRSRASPAGWGTGAATSAPGGVLRAGPTSDGKRQRGWKGGLPPGQGLGNWESELGTWEGGGAQGVC